MLTISLLSLFGLGLGSGSGWITSYSGSESLASFLTIKVVWANEDEDDDVPSANGSPAKDLCVKFENSKNVIQGSGYIYGTDHEDFIVAVGANGKVDDKIFGKDMPDVIFGDVGIETVYGGAGGDTVQGGPGNDQLLGEGGDDHLFGGFDDDLIVGGRGNNHLFGDIGNDVLMGGENSGANYFDCGDGFDTIIDFNLNKGDVTAGNCEIF